MPFDVLRYQVKFQVYQSPRSEPLQIRYFPGVRNNPEYKAAGMKLSDGETYPTYHGWLMYEYSGDSGPGQSNGQGIKSFGGTWYALNASGDLVKSGGGGGGGGY